MRSAFLSSQSFVDVCLVTADPGERQVCRPVPQPHPGHNGRRREDEEERKEPRPVNKLSQYEHDMTDGAVEVVEPELERGINDQ